MNNSFFGSRTIALLCVGASLAMGQASIAPEQQLPGLSQLLDEALANSPRMMIRNADAAGAISDYKAAKAARLPTLSGYMNWTRGQEDRQYYSSGAQEAEKFGYSIGLNQPLFAWNTINLGVQSAKIRQQIDEGYTAQARLSLAQGVRSAYIGAITSAASVERARMSERIKIARFQEITDRRKQNLASDADVFNSGLEKDAAILERINADESYRRAVLSLARLVGISENEVNIPAELPRPNADQIGSYAKGLIDRARSDISGNSTAIRSAEKSLQITENDLKITGRTLRPRVNFTAGVTKDEQSLTADPSSRYVSDYYYAGLSVSWSIFDGFATRNRTRSLLSRKRSAELALEVQKQDFLDNLTRISAEMERNAFSLQLEERKYESAQNHLKFTREQSQRGEASAAQVEAAELNERLSRLYVFLVRSTYWNSVVELIALTEVDPAVARMTVSPEQ